MLQPRGPVDPLEKLIVQLQHYRDEVYGKCVCIMPIYLIPTFLPATVSRNRERVEAA